MNDRPPRLDARQQFAVYSAHSLLAAAGDPEPRTVLAELIGVSADAPRGEFYAAAFGLARVTVQHLLDVIDELTGGQS